MSDQLIPQQPCDGLKVIFLDVDGVLNCYKTVEKFGVFRGIEQSKVELVRRLVKETGAKIVVSSTWRKTQDHHCELLRQLNLGRDVIGATPVTNFSRHEEIKLWLSKHPEVKGVVVLDDDCRDGSMMAFQVITDNYNGLQEYQMDQARRILAFPFDFSALPKPKVTV